MNEAQEKIQRYMANPERALASIAYNRIQFCTTLEELEKIINNLESPESYGRWWGLIRSTADEQKLNFEREHRQKLRNKLYAYC